MRVIGALLRASWLAASSYRLGMVLSVAGLVVTLIPVYFVAEALQPVVANSIQGEGRSYFGFLVVGLGVTYLIATATRVLPQAVAGGISTGTLEALLATPATGGRLILGMVAYGFLWTAIRLAILTLVAWLLGAPLVLRGLPLGIVIVALIALGYFGVGMVAAALVLVFRTSGPLIEGVLSVSALLGGVYYSTSVIPSWLQSLSGFVPLTYGLRALRRVVLAGAEPTSIAGDVGVLALFVLGLGAGGLIAFHLALSHARSAGTLSHY